MNPAQNYIVSTPDPYRSMLIELQAIIKHTIPEIEESFKWNLPFYSLHGKMFCFLNFRKKFIDVGFPNGIEIKGFENIFIDGEKRKRLRSLRYYELIDINILVLQKVLLAAVAAQG